MGEIGVGSVIGYCIASALSSGIVLQEVHCRLTRKRERHPVWVEAKPVALGAGIRGVSAARERLLECAIHGIQLRARVEIDVKSSRRMVAVTGRVDGEGAAVPSDVDVCLFVDGQEVERTKANEFGEFDFPPRQGKSFGVSLCVGGDQPVRVKLIDLPDEVCVLA